MPVRSNPFYTYQDKAIGQGFDGLAAIMAGQQASASKAPAPNAVALADKYRAETQGIISKNDALNTPPAMLAELFINGGKVVDDPVLRNPRYNPDQQVGLPANFDLTTPVPVAEYEPMFQPGRSAQEKMGMAIQEALIRGIKADDIAKLFAQAAYLNNVNAGTPEAGMPYMPLFGQTPTTSTALTVDQQNKMSARDANEARIQAESVARIQGVNSANVANINQEGADRRYFINPPAGKGKPKAAGASKPPATPAVTPTTIKGMTNVVTQRLKDMGFSGVDPRVVDGLVSVASQRYQDPDGAFKNPAAAVDTVLNDLNAGTLPGFESATQPGRFLSSDKKTLSRTAPAPAPAAPQPKPAPKQDPLAAARDAIARGAPKDAVIKRLRENGIDPKGL